MLSAQMDQPVTDLADTFFRFRINTLTATAYALLVVGFSALTPFRKKRKGDSRVKIVSMIAKVRTRSQHVQRDNVIRTRSQQFQRNKVTTRSAHHIRLYAILFSYQ